VVIYTNGSCSRFIESVTSLIRVFTGGFLGVIKCKKERLTNTVVISNTWSFIKGPKVVRNTSRGSCS
jgi:hypothetical protein